MKGQIWNECTINTLQEVNYFTTLYIQLAMVMIRIIMTILIGQKKVSTLIIFSGGGGILFLS